jgi:hypothetical protein
MLRHHHRHKEGVKGIGDVGDRGKLVENNGPLQVVDHGADPVRLETGLEPRIPARPLEFIELRD